MYLEIIFFVSGCISDSAHVASLLWLASCFLRIALWLQGLSSSCSKSEITLTEWVKITHPIYLI